MKDRVFTITREWLLANSTKRGGYTKAQIKAVGLKYPLVTGWMDELVGREITTKQASDFEAGADIYSKAGTVKFKKLINSINRLNKQELTWLKAEIEEKL